MEEERGELLRSAAAIWVSTNVPVDSRFVTAERMKNAWTMISQDTSYIYFPSACCLDYVDTFLLFFGGDNLVLFAEEPANW